MEALTLSVSSTNNLATIGSIAVRGTTLAGVTAQNQDPTQTANLGRVGSFLGISSPAAAGRPVTADLLIGRTSPTDAERGAGFLPETSRESARKTP